MQNLIAPIVDANVGESFQPNHLPPMYLSVVVLTDDLLKKEIKIVKHFWFREQIDFHRTQSCRHGRFFPDSRF